MTIFDLKRRKLDISKEMSALLPKSGAMSAESRTKYDALASEMLELSETILAYDSGEMSPIQRRNLNPEFRGDPAYNPANFGQTLEPSRPLAGDFQERDGEKRYRKAFRSYLRSGHNGERLGLPSLSDEDRDMLRYERRDMGISSPTASVPTSVLVPQGFFNDIEVAMKYYGPMMDVAKIISTATGQPLPYPTANDVANAATVVGEGQQVSELDVTVANIIFGAWKLSSGMVKVSLELLQDSAFELEAFLKQRFGERFGRGLNTLFTNGTGTSQPTGFTVNAVAGPTAVGSSANDGSSATGGTSIGSKDVINLIQSVDPWYRPGSIFQMHDQTRAALENTLDKFGRPLFIPNPQSGRLESLYGYPIRVNNDLPTIAVNAKTVYFGRFDKYVIRKVKDMSVVRLVERFADYGQVAFIGFARYDGNLLDAGTHPIKYLVQAAS